MTVDEFVAWAANDRSAYRWQLIDGEPVAMAPPADTHGSIVAELSRLIGNHLAQNRPSCRVINDIGVIPGARANTNFRVPDLGVTCAPPGREVFIEHPILLIEVLSPSNESATRANVRAYVTLPSVLEILLVQSTRIEAELLRREPDGNWPEVPKMLKPDDTLTLASIGFDLPLRAAYRTTFLAAG